MRKLLLAFLLLSSLLTAGCFSHSKNYSDTRFLMDTVVKIDARGESEQILRQTVDEAFRVFTEVADETDRYQDGAANGLYRLNASAGRGPFAAGSHLLYLARMSKEQPFEEFDASLAPLIDLWRRHGIAKTVPGTEELAAAQSLTGKNKYTVNAASGTVTLLTGAGLDLGALAKGYAVDKAAAILTGNKKIAGALVNAGGNIKAVGTKPDGKPWRIALQHPRKSDDFLGVIKLAPQEAVATSGDYQRYYEAGGQRFHHLLDPQTGLPARHAIAVTVVAPSALTADFYSTLLFVLPPEKAIMTVESNSELGAVIVRPDNSVYVSPSLATRFEPAR